jgi:hypothetical protein
MASKTDDDILEYNYTAYKHIGLFQKHALIEEISLSLFRINEIL